LNSIIFGKITEIIRNIFKSLRISRKKIAPNIIRKISKATKNPFPYEAYKDKGRICQ
jgi:uncharacterized protein with ATP-grasp and redox domains